MGQELLHKMFKGEATDNELAQIRQWVNAGKANRETFYHERALFDALQLNTFQKKIMPANSPYHSGNGSEVPPLPSLSCSYYITSRYSPIRTSKRKRPSTP